jgi:LysM repeat protein
MKSALHTRTIATFLWVATFLLGGLVQAQASNLLINGGFESSFIGQQGEQPREVAEGWTAWNVPRTSSMPSFQNTSPKYIASTRAIETGALSRVRTGQNAQVYFSFFETHDGGIYQRVTGITPGTELRFSVYAYVWSTTFDDQNLSEDPGDVSVRVGIDPTGGVDPLASSVQYSTPLVAYDAYREYSIIATAQTSAVTVFVRSTVGEPVQYTYIYLDDAVLAPTTPTVTATNTSAPPTATNTSVPPTATDTPAPVLIVPTNTPEPIAVVPTNTPEPIAVVPTNTPEPIVVVPTNTPEPIDPTPTPEAIGQVPTATPIGVINPTSTPNPNSGTGGNTGDSVLDEVLRRLPGRIVHTVRRGDTVGRVSTIYGSSINAIISLNGLDENALIFVGQALVVPVPVANPATEVPTATPLATATPDVGTGGPLTPNLPSGTQIYIVQVNDTLSLIARRYNTTLATLTQLNGILNPNLIFIGQRLIVPSATGGSVVFPVTPQPTTPTTYVVQPGDTLFRIALRLNVNLVALANANNITNYNRIFVGQVLVIPR